MNKGLKYLIWTILAGLISYNSVYFRPLDEKLAEGKKVEFDAASFVKDIWGKDLLPIFEKSTNITSLLEQLRKDSETAFKQEAQALGIGNIGYFKVQGTGIVSAVNENNVLLQVNNLPIEIETEFIFGNAIRDASGLIKINDYDETADFNAISESINDKIRKEVIPNFRVKIKEGDNVKFNGAIELNKAHLNLQQPEVIPVTLQIIQ